MKILLSATLALLLLGCSNEQNSSSEEVSQSVQKVAEVVKTESKVVAKIVKKEMETTAHKVAKKSDEIVTKIVNKVEKVEVPKKIVKEITKPIIQKVDGAKLFTKCVSCHGQNAEKKALNKSNIIKGWETNKIVTAINGYKDGSYGSSMKGVMKPQVAKLTKDEVQALAEYISKL